jgi:phosphohistidine phosphatase SixA
MMLETLIVIRHGEATGFGLTERGRLEMKLLAQQLSASIEAPAVILTSPAPRAKLSASILSQSLGKIPVERHECLRSDPTTGERFEEALELVEHRGGRYRTVILSTHLPFVQRFPTVWGEKRGLKIPELEAPSTGTARITDVETGRTIWTRP